MGILTVKYQVKNWVSQYGLVMAFNNILVHGAIWWCLKKIDKSYLKVTIVQAVALVPVILCTIDASKAAVILN